LKTIIIILFSGGAIFEKKKIFNNSDLELIDACIQEVFLFTSMQ